MTPKIDKLERKLDAINAKIDDALTLCGHTGELPPHWDKLIDQMGELNDAISNETRKVWARP